MNPQVVIPLVMMVCILIIGIVIFVVMSQQKTDDQDADEEEEEEEEEGTIGEGEMDTMEGIMSDGGDRSLFKPAGTIEQNEDGSIAEHKGGGLSTTTWKTEDKPKTPVDCEGSWSAKWSSCSTKCEGGKKTKKWTTTKWPKDGGKACPSPKTLYQDCGSGPCSVNWDGSANTSGGPEWEEFTGTAFTGTKLKTLKGKELKECKDDCIKDTSCAGITIKQGKENCHLYGGDATPNPSKFFTSYTLSRG
tara:strand:- start:180 stop:920 length:741 start_codon:yes stop_codon:yes gene_type:complete